LPIDLPTEQRIEGEKGGEKGEERKGKIRLHPRDLAELGKKKK